MKNKNGFITIPLIILALIGITFGIGYAMQRQSKDTAITAQNEKATSSESVGCQCDVQKSDILKKDDVLNIILENKALLRGDKGDRGEVGPIGPVGSTGSIGQTGQTGSVGPTGPVGLAGPKGDSPLGYSVRFCVALEGIEPYPKNRNCYVRGEDRLPGDPSSPIYRDCCEMKSGGTITNLWVVSEEKRQYGENTFFWESEAK